MKHVIQKCLIFLALSCTMLRGQTSEISDLIKEGHVRQAQTLLQQIDVTQMETDRLLFLQGLLSTDGDSAVVYYEELLVRHPQSQFADDALFRLGQIKYAQGLYRTAKIRFQRLSSEYPQSSLHQRCQYWIALCHAAVGETDSAADQFRSAIEDFPTTELKRLSVTRQCLQRKNPMFDTQSKSEPSQPKTEPSPARRITSQRVSAST
jgi:tetratricopeptide (TPR) repeat protein